MRTARIALLAALPLTAAACQSQWYSDGYHAEIVRTEVVIHTDPEGEVVYFDGVRQAEAPIRVPVEYRHVTQQFFRQSNYGAQMRENASGVTAVLIYPLSIPASLFHGREEMKRHAYDGNRHVLTIRGTNGDPIETTIELQGEEEFQVTLTKR